MFLNKITASTSKSDTLKRKHYYLNYLYSGGFDGRNGGDHLTLEP